MFVAQRSPTCRSIACASCKEKGRGQRRDRTAHVIQQDMASGIRHTVSFSAILEMMSPMISSARGQKVGRSLCAYGAWDI